ncbi:hypothetical protein CBC_0712 [Clostridium botulinum C str. Eklund]|uniref:hypothetical protein n=1 Tax=Clostridium botulinum TaxID=1491 RepID=UPI0001668BDA|nr:hypothetical protein [Clostridium botulinum]EDS78084.1 hypothetical protein CBC_0712 [Clostridium botulinum C str. Eklund]KEH90451.1 hypothetical protein Z963_p0005 [Clostridium botulinum C/D str. It1]NEZ50296.1 hypothetical protein [Clostridium botulinum]
MKLNECQKFILPDDDGNLILITEIDFDYEALQNKIIPMRGIKFEINYVNNTIKENGEVDIQSSFSIDGIFSNSQK